MGIDAKTAAKVAQEAGLSLSDAAALKSMAADEKEAKSLAETFSGSKSADALADSILKGY
ncbi:MAG: hypothetical protein ACR2KQ_09905 [Actinomycetota bacterium]